MGQGHVRAWVVVAGVLTVLLVAFLVVEWLQVPVLVDPRSSLDDVSVLAAIVGVGLLVVDAVAPVPSSVVMVALGATFGFAAGLALSLVGSVGGFALGYVLGRRSQHSLDSVVDPHDLVRAAALVRRWGVLAVVTSRPLPLLAETVAFATGAFGMRAAVALTAALVGSAGPAALFCFAGWRGVSTADGFVVFAVVAVAASLCWLVGRRYSLASTGV